MSVGKAETVIVDDGGEINFLSDPTYPMPKIDTPEDAAKIVKVKAADLKKPVGVKKQYDPKKVQAALDDLVKRFGDGVINTFDGVILPVDAIPTGSIGLDLALGVGGVPRGRVTEVYGPESSGKTTLCQHIVAEAQKMGGLCAYIDMEHSLDPSYAMKCGVDMHGLYLAQPDNGEQALEITEALVTSGQFMVIIVDSIAALVPQSEIEGDMGDATMGKHARLMSQAMRKINPLLLKTGTTLIFTNQLRMKIGVMFGNPETTTGGQAMKFYASVRMDVRRIQAVKDGQDVIGSRARVRVVKNKVAPPFREAEFDIMYASGISKMGDLVDVGSNLEVITKRGAFFSYGETRIGQGRENSRKFLEEHPDMAAEIYAKVMATAKEAAQAGKMVIPASADTSEPD